MFTKPVSVEFGWLYPPFAAVFFWLFTALSLRGALAVWMAVNVGLVLVLVAVSARRLRAVFGNNGAWAAAAALVCTSLPVAHCLKWGQVSLLVAVGAIVALRASVPTAPVLGFLTGLKLFPAGYLLGAVGRNATRTTVATLAWALSLGVLLPLVVLGPETTWTFFGVALRSIQLGEGSAWMFGRSTAFWGGAGLSPAFVRWFRDGSHAGLSIDAAQPLLFSLPSFVVTGASLALSVALVVACYFRLRAPRNDPDYAAALCLSTITLVLNPAWHHYFAFMPFAQAVALSRGRGVSRALAVASWGASALCFLLLRAYPAGYYLYSAWGGTTLSCALVLASLHAPARFSAAIGNSRPSV